jgi:hypothetical protein
MQFPGNRSNALDLLKQRIAIPLTVAVLCAAGFCPLIPVHGQIVTASLQGTVQDSSGAVIPGASVKVVNTSTGIVSQAVTDNGGRYVVASLTPGGPYEVTVEATGFKTFVHSGIFLAVNQIAEVPITLQVGATSQKVEVVADASQLDTSTAAIGQVIGNRDVENLPLNQRNVYGLMFLMPGVTGSVSAQYNGLNMSVDGGRPGATNILVDGIPASPPLVNPIGGFSVFPSVDAVQEFKVQANNYSAEFGRSGSGIVNVILKSGTNQFHGSLFEFIRNSDLDSNTYFANENHQSLPHFERSQFGGNINGPIVKDKSFFLFSYEGLRQGTQAEVTTTVPTALQRTGDFSQTYNLVNNTCQPVIIYDPATTTSNGAGGYTRQAFPGNVIPNNPSRIDPVAAKIVNYYPLPNQTGDACTGNNNYFAAGVSKLNIDTYDTRFDEVLNDRNRFFVRYSRRNLLQPPNLLFPKQNQVAEGGSSQPQVSNSAAIDYTFSPNQNLVIDIPAGFSRMLINFVPISAGFNPSTELGFPGYIASNADHLLFPTIAPSNYYTLGDGGAGATRHGAFQIYTVGANATKVVANHVIKFGGTFWLLQANDSESGASTGSFSFSQGLTQGPNPNVASPTAGNSIASLLLGLGSGNMTIDSKIADTTSRYYGIYVQDDWKVLSKLTLNLGLRYDLEIPRTERHNRMETFNPVVASPLASTTGLTNLTGGVVFAGVNGASRRQFNPQWGNFGPRFGFSYALNNNTDVRGAYGIYYGPSLRAAGATVGNEGFSAVTTYTGSADGLTPSVYLSNPFPNGLNKPVGNSQGLLTGIGSSFENPVTGDNKVGYNENWEFDVQRQLPFNLLVDVAYVGSHGVHLNKSGENDWNADQLTTATLALGSQLQKKVTNPFYGIINTGVESSATIPLSYLDAPFPQFTAVQLSYLGGGYEDYSSFQIKVNKRLSHNLSALVSYTGSKQIDDYSIISNVGHSAGGIQNIYNPGGERAVSSNDISRNLVISGVYGLPFGRGQTFGANWNRMVDAAAGGWQLNGIITEQDGFPLAVTTQNTSQSGSNVLRPNMTGTSPVIGGSVKSRLNGYLSAAAFSQPAPFTFGDASRTLSDVRGPGYHDIDFSMFKNFHPTERIRVQFRVESFNLLNQVQFGLPNTVLTSGQFGKITSQANTPRQIQGALKILF